MRRRRKKRKRRRRGRRKERRKDWKSKKACHKIVFSTLQESYSHEFSMMWLLKYDGSNDNTS